MLEKEPQASNGLHAGSGLTARVATKVRSSGLEVVEASEAEAAAVKRAGAAAQAAREKAEEAQDLANSGKTTREDLRIRAEVLAPSACQAVPRLLTDGVVVM